MRRMAGLDLIEDGIIKKKPDNVTCKYKGIFYLNRVIGVVYITQNSPQYISGYSKNSLSPHNTIEKMKVLTIELDKQIFHPEYNRAYFDIRPMQRITRNNTPITHDNTG
jgi:hypothetical protein